MKTAVKYKVALVVILVLALALAAALLFIFLRPEEPDPHEGQVYINDGFGMVWMTPLEGVDVNPFTQSDFRIINGQPHYSGSDFETLRGIDVSEHQYDIDWSQAAADIDFAFIRLGYRGNTEGGLYLDPYYEANIQGAADNGLDTGIYFFSQAITVQEAIEEAEFVLENLQGRHVTLPVVYDWEKIEGGGARTDSLDPKILTDCAVAFCETIKRAGYEPCVYFNRYLGYYAYDLSRLTDFKFWLAVPGDFPDFYYASDIWQYTFTAAIPGISTETDMNMLFVPKTVETPSPEA